MLSKKIVIGSRGSELALWQAHFISNELQKIGIESSIKIIKTQGDKIQHLSLEKLEGKGFFTKEIEDALLREEIDIAVHSHKDLPTENTPGLCIGAVSDREDPSELLLIRKRSVDLLQEFQLKKNAIVGTSSARRFSQLKFFRPDVICADIRGNVPTRISKLRDGNYDAILIAFAGVFRLQLNVKDLHFVKIEPKQLIPAPAQGALAIQCRDNDFAIKNLLAQINSAETNKTISIERKIMQLFKGGCHMPLGVYCKQEAGSLHIWASQAQEKSSAVRRIYVKTNEDHAAEEIFQKLQTVAHKSVFITRELNTEQNYYKVLHEAGYYLEGSSLIEFKQIKISELPHCNWLFFTSKNGVKYFFEQIKTLPPSLKIAAFGKETATVIHSYGFKTHFVGDATINGISTKFSHQVKNSIVCFPQAKNARESVIQSLFSTTEIIKLPVYQNDTIKRKLHSHYDILVFTSPLNVDGYLIENLIDNSQIIIAIGETTKSHLESKGINQIYIPPDAHLLSVAELICGL